MYIVRHLLKLHAVNAQLSCVRVFKLRRVSADFWCKCTCTSPSVSRNVIKAVSHACGRQLLVIVFETKFPPTSQYPRCKYTITPPFSCHKLQQEQKVNVVTGRVAYSSFTYVCINRS
jgi:hypothetical protein